jgi:hypothetical protein
MRVKIGKYKNWFGPHQLAETLCFWAKDVKDKYGFKEKPQWVYDFGEWLAHGSVEPDEEVPVGTRKPFLSKERHTTWLYKLLIWIDKKKKRTVKIQIDPWDTWSADNTLALIILPMLKQLQSDTHGSPFVEDEDVPEHLRSTVAPAKENDWDTDDNHHKRWEWVMAEMINAFECCANDDWENQFYSGDHTDTHMVKLESGYYEMVRGENYTFEIDHEGMAKANERIQNGLRLFGKYFRGLWS